MVASRATFVVLSAVAAMENPTGDCTADSNGARWAYHSPGNDVYVPDCESPLKREYWRVFYQETEGTAYMIPRPDGVGLKYNFCGSGELDALFKKYNLCVESTSDLKMNSMDLADAMRISHAIHEKLVFESCGQGEEPGFCPWAPDDDILACCSEGLATGDAAKSHCKTLEERCTPTGECDDMLVIPSKEAVDELVPALNQLYGISHTPGSNTGVENPTGQCKGEDNGARPRYHYPGDGDIYIPDCKSPLKREYWRVFYQESKGTAYMIPRPDGLGLEYELCGSGEVGALFEKYNLCVESTSDLKMNSMELADAMKISHALHEKLVFKGCNEGDEWRFCPWAPDDDLLACCDQDLATGSEAKAHCQALEDLCSPGGECMEMAVIPSKEAVEQLVPALNKLYGASDAFEPSSASMPARLGVAAILAAWTAF